MIIGTVVFIFCILGIYGYYSGNLFLTYLGLILAVLEHVIGISTGEEKGLTSVWIAFFCALVMTFAGNNFIKSIAICMCFENVICFVLGMIMIVIFGTLSNKKTK